MSASNVAWWPLLGLISGHVSMTHDDVIKYNIFRVTGPLCGEFTGHRWIPLTKASDAEIHQCLSKYLKAWVVSEVVAFYQVYEPIYVGRTTVSFTGIVWSLPWTATAVNCGKDIVYLLHMDTGQPLHESSRNSHTCTNRKKWVEHQWQLSVEHFIIATPFAKLHPSLCYALSHAFYMKRCARIWTTTELCIMAKTSVCMWIKPLRTSDVTGCQVSCCDVIAWRL